MTSKTNLYTCTTEVLVEEAEMSRELIQWLEGVNKDLTSKKDKRRRRTKEKMILENECIIREYEKNAAKN